MKVIVYGTLKKGGALHGYMEHAEFLTDVAVTGYKMYDSGYGYPFVVKSKKEKDAFWGEKYEVTENALRTLDMVEGVGAGLFKRVDLKDEKKWEESRDSVYLYIGDSIAEHHMDDSREIKSGMWEV